MSLKNKAVTIKLTESEFALLEEEAKYRKQTKSEVTRSALDQYYDQLHIFKEIDVRIQRLESKIDSVALDEAYLDTKFIELAKRDKAIYRAVSELIQLAKAGAEQ